MKKYTADFETATWNEFETWVWAWAVCEIGNEENIIIENNIESFIEFCKNQRNAVFYFHNLKFDSEFIMYYLLTNGYTHITDRKEAKDKTFTTLISDSGSFYQLTIYFKKEDKKVIKATFIDSLKIIPFKVSEIAKAFGLQEQKLEIDYNTERGKNHLLTPEEKDYIKNDVVIVAKALNVLFGEGLEKMTQGSNALHDFQKLLTKRTYKHYFPELDIELDSEIRKSYKGGFTYLNPIYKEVDVGSGVVLDINSLYPSVMRFQKLPYDEPVYYVGKYQEDKVYDLYIQKIRCSFKLKENKLPTIQIKNRFEFKETEYLITSNDEIVTLTLTSIDLKLFFEQYDVTDLTFEEGWKFKSINGIFDTYIDKWVERKIKASKEGNKGQRTLSKLMLNALYGKFATSLKAQSKIPYIENGVVHYRLGEMETKKGLYIPIGAFITAYAREKTIRTSQAIKDYSLKTYGKDLYIYSDTDSIHCLLSIEELKKFCDIDDYELGKWKHESTFTRARFIRSKCYIEEIDDELKITCAGLPPTCYKFVNWKNFKTGFKCKGKLTFTHIKGGVLLKETEFTIKTEEIKTAIARFKK